MAECDYCPRAGLVAYESRPEDTGDEWSVENLDYLPMYNLREINRELNSLCPDVYRWLAVALAIVLLTSLLAIFFRWYFLVCGAISLAVVGKALAHLVPQVVTLAIRRAKAQKTPPRTPDPSSPKDEPVDWWEIQNAGFDATVYKEPLVDHQLGLRGKPWKVLRNYDVVIPVIRRRSPKRLRRRHYARVAAYCRLIERCEGVTCPYGLILEAGTYRAIAVKNTATAQQTLQALLDRARSVIREVAETGDGPPVPDSSGACLKCPIGFPVLYRRGETEFVSNGKRLPIVPAYTTRIGVRHSKCGDRFRWTPPHERVEQHKAVRRP